MIDLILSEIKHLWYSKKYLPKLKRLEYLVTQELYYSFFTPEEIKDRLFFNEKFTEEHESDGLFVQINKELIQVELDQNIQQLKNLFNILPLKTKLKKLNDIKFYVDQSTFYEEYMVESTKKKVVTENYLLLFYAEAILKELPKEKQNNFIELIAKKVKDSYPGYKLSANHEEKTLLKWKLDLSMKTNQATPKLNKI
jgi:hypothetical protein